MTDDNLPAVTTPTAPVDASKERSAPRRVTGRLKTALDFIVHEALEMDEAAKRAGLTTRGVRKAMAKPWVAAYMREQRALLLTELTAGNPHHLRTLRGASPNQMVRLGAVRAIEDIVDGRRHGGVSVALNVDVRAGFILDLREDDER